MKPMTVYNKIQEYLDKRDDGILLKFQAECKEWAQLEDIPTVTETRRYKAAMAILKNPERPMLAKTVMRDGLQVFTNSFVAFWLSAKDMILALPTHEGDVADRFPKMQYIADEKYSKSFETSAEDLFIIIQSTGKHEYVALPCSEEIWVDPKLLDKFLKVMAFNPKERITVYYNNGLRPIKFVKGESFGIILPVRRFRDITRLDYINRSKTV